MIVREDPDSAEVLCIPQSQHAAISGRIAETWGGEAFPPPAPWTAVCEAAARHDDGMDDFDAEPDLDPDSGLPRSFMRMPLASWLDCWRRGPSLVAEDSPYAGILVSLHGCGLLARRRLHTDDERLEAADYLAEQEELREEWAGEVERDPDAAPGLGAAALAVNRDLLVAWDAMSLAVCMPRMPETFDGVPGAEGPTRIEVYEDDGAAGESVGPPLTRERTVRVSPWPFSEPAVELEAWGRVLSERYEDREMMQAALAAAEPVALRAVLLPG
jgi:hypothetical protein